MIRTIIEVSLCLQINSSLKSRTSGKDINCKLGSKTKELNFNFCSGNRGVNKILELGKSNELQSPKI